MGWYAPIRDLSSRAQSDADFPAQVLPTDEDMGCGGPRIGGEHVGVAAGVRSAFLVYVQPDHWIGAARDAIACGFLTMLSKWADALGQLSYLRDRRAGRVARMIEYKQHGAASPSGKIVGTVDV